ncbi:hypothetical protein HY374_02100 [Candidatus Berkelbacteria bacterium]|nr:hypothetical protein [Candidatus Berkelbacteria bacterium]
MQIKWNFLGNTANHTGQAITAGFGSTIDTITRYLWLVTLPFVISVTVALFAGSSWWLSIVGVLLIFGMVWMAIQTKGLWTIGFLTAVDIGSKTPSRGIRQLLPGLSGADFRLIGAYFRSLILIGFGVGTLLLIYSALPIWEAPRSTVVHLFAVLLYALGSTPQIRDMSPVQTARGFILTAIVAIMGYLVWQLQIIAEARGRVTLSAFDEEMIPSLVFFAAVGCVGILIALKGGKSNA